MGCHRGNEGGVGKLSHKFYYWVNFIKHFTNLFSPPTLDFTTGAGKGLTMTTQQMPRIVAAATKVEGKVSHTFYYWVNFIKHVINIFSSHFRHHHRCRQRLANDGGTVRQMPQAAAGMTRGGGKYLFNFYCWVNFITYVNNLFVAPLHHRLANDGAGQRNKQSSGRRS